MKSNHIVFFLTVGFVVLLYWVGESYIDFLSGKFPSIWRALVQPGSYELLIRFFTILIFIAFTVVARSLFIRHQRTAEEAQLQREFSNTLFNNIFDMLAVIEPDGTIHKVNDTMCTYLEYTRAELEGSTIESLQAPHVYQNLNRHRAEFADFRRSFLGQFVFISKSGIEIPVEGAGGTFTSEGHNYIIASFRDLRERRQREGELQLSQNLFQSSLEGIVVTDKDGAIEKVNPAFTDITGYTSDEAIGQNPRILKSDHHPNEFYKEMWDTLLTKGVWEGEIWNRKKSGEAYPEWLSITTLYNDDGSIRNFISMFHDISEKKFQEAKLQKLAYHDALTGLPNRQLFMDRIQMAISSAARNDGALALLFLDIDDFKYVNDTYGHPAGDQLLKQVKQKVSEVCRDEDTFARYGGDEFVLLLNGVQNSQAVTAVVLRILKLFREPFVISGNENYVSVSIGIAMYPEDGEDAITLLKHADLALYNAKSLGKNTFAFFKKSLNTELVRRNYIESEMRKAIKDECFQLYYQPKIDLETGSIVSLEALLRWQLQDGSWISPGEFIPIAEQTDLIYPIGSWVFSSAMQFLDQLHRLGYTDISMGVNVSPKQFLTRHFVDEIGRIVNKLQIPPENIVLEITEYVLMQNIDYTIQVLTNLHQQGYKLSIDDFGTGYSSLSYLKEFPVSEIKIDRSFVKDLPDSPHASAITRSLIAVSRTLGYTVVAEGVETESQTDFLRQHKCPVAQGYLFSKPLPPKQLEEILSTQPFHVPKSAMYQ